MGPVYVAEMAVDKRQRGRSVNSMSASPTIGMASAYWVDFGMVSTHGQVVWRFPVAFQVVLSVASISSCGGFRIPLDGITQKVAKRRETHY
jgi:hypothetical protein